MPFEQLSDHRKLFKNTLTIHDHLLIHYVPLIGGNAFYLYLLYCSLAEKYTAVFPSVRSLKQQTGFSFESIAKYNKILETVGLIAIKKNNINNSNHYILQDPHKITKDLENKLNLHEDFKPLLDVIPVFGKTEHRCSEKPSTDVRKNRAPVFGKTEHINNKSVVVNFNNKTTTIKSSHKAVASLLTPILELSDITPELITSSEMILRSALKHVDNPEEAVKFIQNKCATFTKQIAKAKDKLAFIHAVVIKNWSTTAGVKHQADQKNIAETVAAEKEQQKSVLNSWRKLTPEKRASYFTEHIKKYFRIKKHPLNDNEFEEALATLVSTGRYGNFLLEIPPLDFKGDI